MISRMMQDQDLDPHQNKMDLGGYFQVFWVNI